MLWCWQLLYQSRPTFTQIKQELNNFEEHQQQSKNDSFQDESNQECKGPNQQGQADSNQKDSGFEFLLIIIQKQNMKNLRIVKFI